MSESSPRVSAPSASASSSGYRLFGIALLLTALAYVGTLRFGFVYDDGPQILANPTLTSWHTLPVLFLGHSWKFLMPNWAGNYYRPLFMSWLLINRMWFGLNPVAWHASTVAVHLLATAMAFIVARQILGNGTQAGFAAILFGLHPIHIESVAWISGVTDPLMAVFVFAAFWAWIRGQLSERNRASWQGVAAVFYLLACLTKETALPFVVVVIAYQALSQGRSAILRSSLGTWPLWIAAAVYLVARTLALRGLVHPLQIPLSHVVMTVPLVLWEYVRRLIWPWGLSVFYDLPPVTGILQWRFWLPVLAWIVVAMLSWRRVRRSRVAAFSLLWIVAFLSPAIIGLPVFLVDEWLHDRYLYLPAFGLCLLLGFAIDHLPSRQKLLGLPAAAAAAIVLLAAAMSFATTWQEQYWANSLLLFVHSVNQAPHNAWARASLAGELFERGDRVNARGMFEAAIQLDPNNWKNNADYALMLYRIGDYRGADEHFTRALAGVPNNINAHLNQGMSRLNYGNYAGAEPSLRSALQLDPNLSQAHYWLGYALEHEGKFAAARCQYLAELEHHPDTVTDAKQRLAALEGSARPASQQGAASCELAQP